MKVKSIFLIAVALLSLSSCLTTKEKLNLTYEAIEENETYFTVDHEWTVTIGEDRYHYSYKKYKNYYIVVSFSLNYETTEYIYRFGKVKKTIITDVVTESSFDMTEDDFLAQYTKESSFHYNIDFDQTKEFTSILKSNFPSSSSTITSNFEFEDTYEYKINLPNITEVITNVSLRLTFYEYRNSIQDFSLTGKNKNGTSVQVNIFVTDFNVDYKE